MSHTSKTSAFFLPEPEPTALAELHDLSRMALFAALIGAGAFIHIPLGPLHFSLQPMFVILAGFMLGPKKAALALLAYLACGFIGLPMFGRGKAGPASFYGPTAGYLAGFLVGALLAGMATLFRGAKWKRIAAMLIFGAMGVTATLLFGVAGLRLTIAGDWDRAMLIGFYPFIIGDLIKMLAAAAITETFFPLVNKQEETKIA